MIRLAGYPLPQFRSIINEFSLTLSQLKVAEWWGLLQPLTSSLTPSRLTSKIWKWICSSGINVTSFSSIPYYSNERLISKIELVQDLQSIALGLDVHASTNKRLFYLPSFKLRSFIVQQRTPNIKGLTLDLSSFFGNLIDFENQVTGCNFMLNHLPFTKS